MSGGAQTLRVETRSASDAQRFVVTVPHTAVHRLE
jgi:hypothetical protein